MVNGDAFCPKYRVSDGMPFRLITVAHFEDRLANVEMTLLDYAVGSRVVAGDANMVYVISLAEIFEGFQPWCAVVGDDFRKSAPAPYEAAHEPIGESLSGFSAKGVEFGPMDERTATLNDIFEAA